MKKFKWYRLVQELIKLVSLLVKLAKLLVKLAELMRELLGMASNYLLPKSAPYQDVLTQMEVQIPA